ncbi:MAG: hypothetical protein MZV65_23440 [Chromatiales bacterium]|nr:hypothetical protein [Chromatiales bacterium]
MTRALLANRGLQVGLKASVLEDGGHVRIPVGRVAQAHLDRTGEQVRVCFVQGLDANPQGLERGVDHGRNRAVEPLLCGIPCRLGGEVFRPSGPD